MPELARIIASYGRRFTVRTDHATYEATTRKKRVDFACGDWVHISVQNQEQAVIEDFCERSSLLYRQDAWKTKIIAANVDKLFIVLAAVPTPSEMLLQRALIAAEAAGIAPFIVLNKSDLAETAQWIEKLNFYQQLGYPVITLSALQNAQDLLPFMQNSTSIFLGQSGMGKSTLTNALLGSTVARIGDLSNALDSGKHTTTHAQLYDIAEHIYLIDSPGLQEFGLNHLDANHLIDYFPDIRHLRGQCRFHNCTHRQEPNCAIKNASEAGMIAPHRLALLQRITDELRR